MVGSRAPLLQSTTNQTNLNVPGYAPRPSITHKFRPDGTQYRSITPLEAIYYHERLDLITHPLIKGLIKWKWDNFAAKRFYIYLALEVLFLISWTCSSLMTPFPIRYVYRFPDDIWRCILWAISIAFLIWQIIQEMFDISYARQRYEDYLFWETERTRNRADFISKTKQKSNISGQSTDKKVEAVATINPDTGDVEHMIVEETPANIAVLPAVPNLRSHHSLHFPLPASIPTVVKGKSNESQAPIDVIVSAPDSTSTPVSFLKKRKGPDTTFMPSSTSQRRVSRLAHFARIFRERAKTRIKSYYMYYSLNNLFDWIVYIFCFLTIITHVIDVNAHTVLRARVHMYIASVTVISIWFRFMVFFRTITISAKTLRSKLVEIKLGELVIMVSYEFLLYCLYSIRLLGSYDVRRYNSFSNGISFYSCTICACFLCCFRWSTNSS